MIDFDNLYSPVSFCGGDGGGGGDASESDAIGIKGSHTFGGGPGRDLGYQTGGYNPQDPEGAWGRPDSSQGDSYSGNSTYGSADGR